MALRLNVLFTLIFSLIVSSGYAFDHRCLYALGLHLGTLIVTDEKFPAPSSSQVHILGGLYGGSVYRVKEMGNPSYLLKKYRNEALLENDLQASRIIREALSMLPDSPFDIVEMKRLPKPHEHWVKYTDVEGWNLASDSLNGLQPELNNQYESALKILMITIKKLYPDVIEETQDWLQLKVKNKTVNIFLHKENIVPNRATAKLTIMDPN
jgi:hypothetical protein